MRPGDVVDGRFEIESRAFAGGMGEVYQAFDRVAGSKVALKLLYSGAPMESGRLVREVEALSAVRHPRIVRYLGHGQMEADAPYIVMEWLTGETLAARLSRSGLTVAESVELATHVAEALSEAHRSGVVHRDLKPSNLFLRGGAIEGITVIDFGIARVMRPGSTLTVPGTMMGTPGYMAPEQARGEPLLGPRADVFSLGCVLYQCLTGRPPFKGDDALAVLLKVVLEEPRRVSDLRPDVPDELSDLVSRMLSKTPEARPPDGAAVALALAELKSAPVAAQSAPAIVASPEITARERRVICLVVARWNGRDVDATLSDAESHAHDAALKAVAERHQGSIELLADGSALVVLKSAEAATDLAMRAARCALSLAPLRDGTTIAVVTGRALITARLPVGELIDRAVSLLGQPATEGRSPASIRLDEVTVGLLGGRFETAALASFASLVSELRTFETARPLLGKSTPCVGREPELMLIESIVAASIKEQASTAVLVTGAVGAGKSRLRSELLRRLREQRTELSIWMGHADPLASGSAFGLLGQAIRGAAGIADGERLEVKQRRLFSRVSRSITGDPATQARVAAFLGEIAGVPFPDAGDVQILAARRDPRLLGDQMRGAFEEFVAASSAETPLLLVLEDLHWGDLPTVSFIDSALRSLPDRPLIVLAFARPDVHHVFPGLWAGRSVRTVELAPLGRKAAERLCRIVLGEDASPSTVQAIVERADGNAFYLEELIRAAARGQEGTLPESVLTMVHARLEAFDAEARRVLRAASVFGATFWEGGVSALLGGADVRPWLGFLAKREVIFPRGEGTTKFPGEAEYGFRHALVVEAAYGMLPEADRQTGHRLAGEWLERAGERDAGLLGEHFERGGEPGRALSFYRRAAEQAMSGDDLGEVLRWTKRAIAGIPSSLAADSAVAEELGIVHRIGAEAHRLRGELAAGEEHAIVACNLLPSGTEHWFLALTELTLLSSRLGRSRELLAIGAELSDRWSRDARSAQTLAMARAAEALVYCGEYARADRLLELVEETADKPQNPQASAWVLLALATRAVVLGEFKRQRDLADAAIVQLTAAGNRRAIIRTWLFGAHVDSQLGLWADAERKLREVIEASAPLRMIPVIAYAQHYLGVVLAHLGALEEAREIETLAVQGCTARGDCRVAGSSRTYLSMILAKLGDLSAAEEEATRAAEALDPLPPYKAHALSARAKVRLAAGRVAEALADASAAAQTLRELGGIGDGEAQVRLTYAEALHAHGDFGAAKEVIAEARSELLVRARRIADGTLRQSFLENVPDNARTIELAREWIGEEPLAL